MQEIKVATSFIGRDIRCKEKKVATLFNGRDIIQWSRHQLQRKKVATSFSGCDITCKEKRSREHLAIETSHPRDAKDKSQPNKSFCDVAETTEVVIKNRGSDINIKMGQLI